MITYKNPPIILLIGGFPLITLFEIYIKTFNSIYKYLQIKFQTFPLKFNI